MNSVITELHKPTSRDHPQFYDDKAFIEIPYSLRCRLERTFGTGIIITHFDGILRVPFRIVFHFENCYLSIKLTLKYSIRNLIQIIDAEVIEGEVIITSNIRIP